MSPDLAGAWASLVDSPVFALTLTLAVYDVARRGWERLGRPALLNPVLVSIVVIGAVLALVDLDYDTYASGTTLITLLLGPATVALAWPMHRELRLVRQAAVPVLAAVLASTAAAVTTALLLTRLAGGPEELALSMAPKTTTTPVAIALSEQIGGIAALTAVLTVATGVLGAALGVPLLRVLRLRDPRVSGLAVGASAHGIGTAGVAHLGRTTLAFAGLGMALATLATSLWVAVLVPLLT